MGMVFNGSKWVYSKGGAGNGRESNNPAPGQKPPRSALYPLLIGQSAPVTGTAIDFVSEGNTQSVKSVDASVSGAGSVSAEVIIEQATMQCQITGYPSKLLLCPALRRWQMAISLWLRGSLSGRDWYQSAEQVLSSIRQSVSEVS